MNIFKRVRSFLRGSKTKPLETSILFSVKGEDSIALFLKSSSELSVVKINSQTLGDKSYILQLRSGIDNNKKVYYQLELYSSRPLEALQLKAKWNIKPISTFSDVHIAKAFIYLTKRVLVSLDESKAEDLCSPRWWAARLKSALNSESIAAHVILVS